MKRILTVLIFLCLGIVSAQPAVAQTCGSTTWSLMAGQYTDVGSVTVTNDQDNIYVTYSLAYPGATFGGLHLWVGNTLLTLPATKNGTPIPGQFCNSVGGACADASGLTTYTFTIPFSALNIVDAYAGCGTSLYVVAHAEVLMDSGTETAFAGDTPVNVGTPGRWWFYGNYTICCDFGQPQACYKETAFAKGGWIWTTDKKSNPEKLPSLYLTKNRWGWAVNLTSTGTTTYGIWAGAGLNNTANGKKVGTLTVSWDGANAAVSYLMLPGYYLEEVHIYADDAQPETVAPGQYGYPAEGYEAGHAAAFSYTVPLVDAAGDGVWLIAHAVVSSGTCQ